MSLKNAVLAGGVLALASIIPPVLGVPASALPAYRSLPSMVKARVLPVDKPYCDGGHVAVGVRSNA